MCPPLPGRTFFQEELEKSPMPRIIEARFFIIYDDMSPKEIRFVFRI